MALAWADSVMRFATMSKALQHCIRFSIETIPITPKNKKAYTNQSFAENALLIQYQYLC
jgi:hypothetical protein